PCNIVNMAKLKGLDVISVTDHNSTSNSATIKKLCEKLDLLFIPGIEIESKEGVHLLCYFPSIEMAEDVGTLMLNHLPSVLNQESIFGPQWVMNEKDEIINLESKLLIQSTSFSVEEIVALTHNRNGVVFAAHVNKENHNILTHLGFIPPDLLLNGIELNDYVLKQRETKICKTLTQFPIMINSDAHSIGDISEPTHFLKLPEKTVEAFISYFKE
ncbi:MAG: PHP domain-containing protein, partial [Turicibacter sp.]